MEKIKSIIKNITKIGLVNVRLFIMVNDPNPNLNYKIKKPIKKWINQMNFSNITFDLLPIIQLDFNQYPSFSKDKRINLLPFHLGKFIKFLKNTINVIEEFEEELYRVDNVGKLSMPYIPSKEDLDKYITIYDGFGGNNFIRANPTIVIDSLDNTYEGIEFFINKKDNSFKLSYDELVGLEFILEKTDFVSLSQTLLLSTILWNNQNNIEKLNGFTEFEYNSIENKDRIQYTNNNNPDVLNKSLSSSITKSPFDELNTID